MKILDFQQVIHHLLSLKKKKVVAFTVFKIKKNQKFYETRIYFLYNNPGL